MAAILPKRGNAPMILVDVYIERAGVLEIVAASVPLDECYPGDDQGRGLAMASLVLSGAHTDQAPWRGESRDLLHVLRPAGA